MLKNRLNKVLFVGPQHITKWMGSAIAKSEVGIKAMQNIGYRLATEDDADILPPDILAQCGITYKPEPVQLDPIEIADVTEQEQTEEPKEAPKRGRPRKQTNTTSDAY